MDIVSDLLRGIGRDVRKDARKLLFPMLLALTGVLTGAAAAAFLTAWAYLALSTAISHASAALLIGLGFALLTAGLLALARRCLVTGVQEGMPAHQPEAPETAAPDPASLVAFTAAFVLARFLAKERRG
jgi:hypothetical protein